MVKQRHSLSTGRLYVVVLMLTVLWIGLEVNLFRLQILYHSLFARIAEQQTTREIKLKAIRGEIFDRNGHKLATNTIHYDLAADPKMVENKKALARQFSRTFKKAESHYIRLLSRDSRFVYLERRVPEADIGEILEMEDAGLIKEKEFIRSYPLNENGGQVLGFTDTDNRGLSGIELQYDEALTGTDGKAVLMYDGPRRTYYSADHPVKKAVPGSSLYLTIDKNIQTIVEQALAEGARKCKARSGMAVVMDPYTGAVLAISNYPSFDPNRYNSYKGQFNRKNRVITDIFEPGSTFKVFAAAALLQERMKNIDDIVFCENGRYKIYNHNFRDSHRGGFAWLSFAKVIEKSSNIGMIKLTRDLHPNIFFRYLRSFGFGTSTEIGLSGEENGLLAAPGGWSGLSKASISIGHEVGVTALQLVTAFSAVVNGGMLPRPYIVRYEQSPDGRTSVLNEPEILRQVISPEVSDVLKTILLNTVKRGTGSKADVAFLEEGGKTGTAQKIDKHTGRYTRNYFSSFIGFAPYEKPRFVCAVFYDEPKNGFYGGDVAAPVFKEIITNIVRLPENEDMPVDEDLKIAESDETIPPLESISIESAETILKERGRKYKIAGIGNFVKDVEIKDDLYILKAGSENIRMETIPDLTGLSLREALRLIDFSRIQVIIKGDGLVRKQSVRAGRKVSPGSIIYLTCK